MSVPQQGVSLVQEQCARFAAQLEELIQSLVVVRASLRLPPDTLAIYEQNEVAWPLEVAIDAALATTIDEELIPAAERLRRTARLTPEQLRQRQLAQRQH